MAHRPLSIWLPLPPGQAFLDTHAPSQPLLQPQLCPQGSSDLLAPASGPLLHCSLLLGPSFPRSPQPPPHCCVLPPSPLPPSSPLASLWAGPPLRATMRQTLRAGMGPGPCFPRGKPRCWCNPRGAQARGSPPVAMLGRADGGELAATPRATEGIVNPVDRCGPGSDARRVVKDTGNRGRGPGSHC